MKLFSTSRRLAPMKVPTATSVLTTRIAPRWCSVRRANQPVMVRPNGRRGWVAGLGMRRSTTGKRRNVTASETPIPIVIIHPKFTTGRMSQTMREEKPATVVRQA